MAKLNKQEQNIADVQFIFAEYERFDSMTDKEKLDYFRENQGEAFFNLKHPKRGLLFCGRVAYFRFGELADRTMPPNSFLAKKFDRSDYVHALRDAFVEIVVDAKKRVDQSLVTKLINRAKRIAEDKLIELSHHIPCALLFETDPSVFVIGPVTFRRVEQFLTETANGLGDYHERCIESYFGGRGQPPLSEEQRAEATAFADRHLKDIHDYYSDYGWVATVNIPPCHETVSRERAERTVDAALDVLRLFAPIRSERYRRANAPNTPYERHELVTDAGGKISASWWRESQGTSAGEGWYVELMKNPQAAGTWKLFETALVPLTNGEITDELNQRVLDALNWFGQGVVEPNPGAQVVKYTAALERLTMTGHVESGIEAVIMDRVGFLNEDRPSKTEKEIQDEIGELYQIRSDLMHGTKSPSHPSVTKLLPIARQITQWSLLKAIQIFDVLRDEKRANVKELAKVYDGPEFPDDWYRVAACYIWEKQGCPGDRDLMHWKQAKAALRRLWRKGVLSDAWSKARPLISG